MGEPHILGGRFSKSPIERERILKRRKDQLLMQARRKYMEKHNGSGLEEPALSNEYENSVRRRPEAEVRGEES